MRYRTPLLALLALVGLLLYSTGCDSASNPVAPTGSVLTVTANPTFIGLSGSSTITVSGFKPDGNPLNPGTLINLSTSQGAIPSVVSADSTGRATATFAADERVGTATVTASLPGNEATATATVEIGEQRPLLEISANPTSIPVEGRSTVSVVARDFNGFALPNQTITLTASNGNVPGEIVTDDSGVAQGVFRANSVFAGNGTVSAFLNNSETTSIEITIRDAPSDVALTASPSRIDRVDEGVPITLTAFVTNGQGLPVGNIVVRFTSLQNIGTFSQTSAPTNSQTGQAAVTLTVLGADVVSGQIFSLQATVTSEGTEIPSDPVEIRVN